jgi:hypothetical protein
MISEFLKIKSYMQLGLHLSTLMRSATIVCIVCWDVFDRTVL